MKRLLRILSIITSIILLVGSLPNYVSAYERGSNTLSARAFWNDAPATGTVYYEDVVDRLNDIMSFYLKPGDYWNHAGISGYHDEFTTTQQPCPFERQYHNDTYISEDPTLTCNSYNENEQCAGFAWLVCKGIFGTDVYGNSDWRDGTVDSLAVGDYVRVNGNHSFVVSWIDPDRQYITIYECNYAGNCLIGTRAASQDGYYFSDLYAKEDAGTIVIRHCVRNTGDHRPTNYTLSLYVDGELFKNLEVPVGNTAYSLMYQDAENEHFYHSVMGECEDEAGLIDEQGRIVGYFWFTNPDGTGVFDYHAAINSNTSIYAFTDPLAFADPAGPMRTVSFYINGELWKTTSVRSGSFFVNPSSYYDSWNPSPNHTVNFDSRHDRITEDVSFYTQTSHGVWVEQVIEQGNVRRIEPKGSLAFITYGQRNSFTSYSSYPTSSSSWLTGGDNNVLVDGYYIDSSLTVKLADAPDSFYYSDYYDYDGERYYNDYYLYYRLVSKFPYEIVYNGNGADGGTYSQNFTNGLDEKAILANTFTRAGYTFAGWNTAADGSGTLYEVGDVVSNLGDTTLYAQWTYTGGDDGGDDNDPTGGDDGGDDNDPTGNDGGGDDNDPTGGDNSDAINHILTPEERGYLTSTITFGTAASGNYELHMDCQGLLYQEVVKTFMPLGYSELQSVNILTFGAVDSQLKQGIMTFKIPTDAIKKERVFAIMAVDKDGVPHIYPDLDFNSDTVTVQVDYEGYAFSIIYIDLPIIFN